MKITAKFSCVALAFTTWIFASASEAQPLQFEAPPKPADGRNANPAKVLSSPALLSELRKGGYIIYLRHTSTDFSRDDARSKSDDDCDNQRPLTDRGRAEAREIGAAFRELKIPGKGSRESALPYNGNRDARLWKGGEIIRGASRSCLSQ